MQAKKAARRNFNQELETQIKEGIQKLLDISFIKPIQQSMF